MEIKSFNFYKILLGISITIILILPIAFIIRPIALSTQIQNMIADSEINRIYISVDTGDKEGIQGYAIDDELEQYLINVFSTIQLSYRGAYRSIEYVERSPIITVSINSSMNVFHVTKDGVIYLNSKRYKINGSAGPQFYQLLLGVAGYNDKGTVPPS